MIRNELKKLLSTLIVVAVLVPAAAAAPQDAPRPAEAAPQAAPSAKTDEADKADKPKANKQKKTVKQVFKDAGFTLHGELPEFYAHGTPAKTAKGIIVAGSLRSHKNPWRGPTAVWRLTGNQVDMIARPSIGPGAGKPWGTFNESNKAGWVTATTYEREHHNKPPFGNHLDQGYLVNVLNDKVQHIKAPKCKQIALCGLNDAGQVVGWYSPTRHWRGFVWSKKNGFTDLGEDGADMVQATHINKHGVIAGVVEKNSTPQPRLWTPPKKAGGEYIVLTLDLPKKTEDAWAHGINDNGVVLVSAVYKRVPVDNGAYYLSRQYLWTKKAGYSAIKLDVEHARSAAIDNQGGVLLNCWKTFDSKNPLDKTKQINYYWKDGKARPLPKYPGSVRTDYRYISKDGLIVGTAKFSDLVADEGKDRHQYAFISFVVSPEVQKNKAKKK